MIIGGLQKFSMLDYPGHLSAIVFTQGCNFRCRYCYNPMLVLPETGDKVEDSSIAGTQKGYSGIAEDDLFAFLEKRRGKLDAVVITGGEPTLHDDLPGFIARIKALDYKVKLDTNGTRPDILDMLKAGELVDYLAMDLKHAPDEYRSITGVKADLSKIRQSVKLIKEGDIPHEFRTTLIPGHHDAGSIAGIGREIRGADKWYLQAFKTDVDLIDNKWRESGRFSDKELAEMRLTARKYVKNSFLR